MPLFHCKFEATIGGNAANNENRQPDNEANQVQPNNENRQPDNPVNPEPENNGNHQSNNPENPDHPNRGNRQPNNPENPDRPNRGNRQPNNPDNPDRPNRGNRQPDNPEFPDPENDENSQYNYRANADPLDFGNDDRQFFSIANQERPKTLFIPQGDTAPNRGVGVTVDSRSPSTNKRPGVNMTMSSSKQQKLDTLFKNCTPKLVPGNELVKDHVRQPDLALKPPAPRNNERFFNPNRDITIIPTIEAINEQVRRAGNYDVFNLCVRHRIHGEIMFLGPRDLSKLEADLSKLVQFCHGKFAIGPNIQSDPVLCTLNNISREDLAKQVSKIGGPPTNDELYRILTALSLVHNAKCWCYNEQDKEWTFLTSPQKGNCKKGGQTNDIDEDDDDNNSDDNDDEEEYFVP